MKLKLINLFPVLVFFLSMPLTASAWSGKCVGVQDGHTISVMHGGKANKIRLYGIYCPVKGQPFGKKARKFTSNFVLGKTVEIFPVTQDRFEGTIAWVFIEGRILNVELLRAGVAWHWREYSRDRDLAILEEEARAKRRGLWAKSNPVPPWEFRHRLREEIRYSEQSESKGEPKPPEFPGESSLREINYSDGSKYTGNIVNGRIHGLGIYIWPSGAKYIGEFKDNMKHGRGIYVWPNGDKYVGDYREDRASGGWLYKADGRKIWIYRNSDGKWVIKSPIMQR